MNPRDKDSLVHSVIYHLRHLDRGTELLFIVVLRAKHGRVVPFMCVFVVVIITGRPEKLPDVCYSWWVLASLKIIGKLHWIDKVKFLRLMLFQSGILIT